MDKLATTDEGLFVMKWRNFLPLMISIIITTNTASIFYQKQQRNTANIEYNKERADRIATRQLDEAKAHFELENLKTELLECKNRLSPL
jgi:hypothetical protein